MPPASKPGGEARLALGAGIGCYLIWGFAPFLDGVSKRLNGVVPSGSESRAAYWKSRSTRMEPSRKRPMVTEEGSSRP